MKPLTIEELRALEVGDWVWIFWLNNNKASGYVTDINFTAKMFTCKSVNRVATTARIADYGKTWLAYKNKEEADGLYDNLHKETAKEIYKRVDEFRKLPDLDPRDSYDCNALDAYNNVCKFINRKYGVEIEK